MISPVSLRVTARTSLNRLNRIRGLPVLDSSRMKILTLVRHAKSDWNYPCLSDHERPLNKRGLAAAPEIGSCLKKRGFKPDALLSSTALRATTTAKLIAGALNIKPAQIQPVADLYLASAAEYEHIISSIDDSANISHAMIFGHNPGTHEFAHYLTGANEIDRFITCAVAMIELDIGCWGEIGFGCGRLKEFFTPRDLPSV